MDLTYGSLLHRASFIVVPGRLLPLYVFLHVKPDSSSTIPQRKVGESTQIESLNGVTGLL